MKIEKIELRQIFLLYKKPFETSGWVEDGNYGIIVKIYSEGFNRDIVLNPFKLNYDGTLNVPDLHGCGAVVDEYFLETVTLRKYETSAKGIFK